MRVALVLLLSMFVSGCAAMGFAAAVAQGTPKMDAKYVPSSRPTAIVVDSYRTGAPTSSFRDSVSSLLYHELKENHVVPLVEPYKVYDLRMRDPKAFKEMKVDAIGRAVGAEQVIYVDIFQVQMSSTVGNQMIKGGMTASIKVIDCKTGATLWPKGFDEGYPYTADTKFTARNDDTNMDSVQEAIARQAADEIAKLFYRYELPD